MNKTWGPEIWEAKNKHHDDVGVILGTGQSRAGLEKNTVRALFAAEKIWFKLLGPKAKILDVGCGPGARFTVLLAKRNFEVTALDASGEALKRAAESLKRAGVKASLMQSDLCEFSVEEKFDSIFCVETFFHLPAHLSMPAFVSFNRALKPEGYIFIQFAVQNELTIGFLAHALLYMTAYKILKPIVELFGRRTFYVTVARHSDAEIQDIGERTGFRFIAADGPYYVLQKVNEV